MISGEEFGENRVWQGPKQGRQTLCLVFIKAHFSRYICETDINLLRTIMNIGMMVSIMSEHFSIQFGCTNIP